jgi:hypothetical protein
MFRTKTNHVKVRWKLASKPTFSTGITHTASSGIDAYYRYKGELNWLHLGAPAVNHELFNSASFNAPYESKSGIEYLIYFPLFNGVNSVDIGVDGQFTLSPIVRLSGLDPIVFYGTSITQGGFASRAGMAYPSIIGRLTGRKVLNFGLSGNADLSEGVAEAISHINASILVIDCVRNVDERDLESRLNNFIRVIRSRQKELPVLLVEESNFQNFFLSGRGIALKKVYTSLVNGGDKNIFYLEGRDLIGNDTEGTVDGVHLNDLGLMRQAKVMEKKIRFIELRRTFGL